MGKAISKMFHEEKTTSNMSDEETNDIPSTSRHVSNEISNSQITPSNITQIAGDVHVHLESSGKKKAIAPSIDEVFKLQRNEKERFLIEVSQDSYEEIKKLFPTLIEVHDYQNELPKKETYEPWSNSARQSKVKQSKSISFVNLATKICESKFVGLVGLPGSGKSSLCVRLATNLNYVCLIVPFMNLNYGSDEKLTLRQLLLDYNYPELTEELCESSFEWILKHQDQCLIIMDGYDQANWRLVENPPAFNLRNPQLVWHLVSNLCNKCYLPNCHILFTSRPHSMTTLPKSIKPDYVINILELSDETMKKLFHAFAWSGADELWKKLHVEAPQLAKLCSTPLLLQLLLIACKSSNDFTSISTMTRLFRSVLSHLRYHAREDDISEIEDPLAELAYNAIDKETVVMRPIDLEEVGLTPTVLQDLVISQHTYTDGSCKVFEGDETLFFIHQTIQEYLTTRHVYYKLSQAGFIHFVNDKLFTPHWAMVCQFLYGIAFDLSKSEKITERMQTRKNLLKNKLIEKMGSHPVDRDLIQLCLVVRESADDEVIKMASQRFPTQASFFRTPLNSSDAHSLGLILKGVDRNLDFVDLIVCELNSESFSFIAEGIRGMKGSIERLSIAYNFLLHNDVTTICSILHKVSVGLLMCECFRSEDGWPYRSADIVERNQIQRSLKYINNEKLEVFVEFGKPPLKQHYQHHHHQTAPIIITQHHQTESSNSMSDYETDICLDKYENFLETKNFEYVCYMNPNCEEPCLIWEISDESGEFNNSLDDGETFKGNFRLDNLDSNVKLQIKSSGQNVLVQPQEVTIKKTSFSKDEDFYGQYHFRIVVAEEDESLKCIKLIYEIEGCSCTISGQFDLPVKRTAIDADPGPMSSSLYDPKSSESKNINTKVIGEEGGKIEFEHCKRCFVEFPRGALDEDVEFVIKLLIGKKDKKSDDFILTPTLHCSPSMKFNKPVTISLPTCYKPVNSSIKIVPQTFHNDKWMDEEHVKHGGEDFIVFTTMSFCRKRIRACLDYCDECERREQTHAMDEFPSKALQYDCYPNPTVPPHCLMCRVQDKVDDFKKKMEKGYYFRGWFRIKRSKSLTIYIGCQEKSSVNVVPPSHHFNGILEDEYFHEKYYQVETKNEALGSTIWLKYTVKDSNRVYREAEFPLPSVIGNRRDTVAGPGINVDADASSFNDSFVGVGTVNQTNNYNYCPQRECSKFTAT